MDRGAARDGDDGFRPDTYGEAFAEVYDAWYGQVSDAPAVARYLAGRTGTGPVLELGVGTGRLAQPLVEAGLRVVGLDASAAMLAHCAARRAGPALQLVRADMAALPFRGCFGAVLIGFNTLFNLGTEAEQQELFASLAPLLAPDGVVVVEANEVGVLAGGPDRWVGPASATGQGLTVIGARLDRQAQTIVGQHVELAHDGARFRPWRLRWATTSQIDRYAAEAGLILVARHGDWDANPHRPDADESHISLYARPWPVTTSGPDHS